MVMHYTSSRGRVGVMSRERRRPAAVAGFALIELLMVIALIVVVTAIGTPFYLSYQRAQETNGAARELITVLNRARQLAITRSNSVSIEAQTHPQNRWRLCTGTATPCPGGAIVTGP